MDFRFTLMYRWTVRNAAQTIRARQHATNATFRYQTVSENTTAAGVRWYTLHLCGSTQHMMLSSGYAASVADMFAETTRENGPTNEKPSRTPFTRDAA